MAESERHKAQRRQRAAWRRAHYAHYGRHVEGRERPVEHYDEAYVKARQSPKSRYSVAPELSGYIKSWDAVIAWLGVEEKVADFGCGCGQFAELAITRSVNYVLGVDFSSAAIDWAKKRNPIFDEVFRVGDLHDATVHKLVPYDVALFLEVLEHVERDKIALSLVPKGKRVVLSVPSYAGTAHVRYFRSLDEVVDRYGKLLKVTKKEKVRTGNIFRVIWLLEGVRL